MKRSMWRKKASRWKKSPSKVKLNGITGKPAGPTTAPGGSWPSAAVAVDALPALVEPAELAEPLVEPAGLVEPLVELVVLAPGAWEPKFAAAAAAELINPDDPDAPVPVIWMLAKLTCVPAAACWIS